MATICPFNKPCKECRHLKFDKEENKKLCFLKADMKSGDLDEEDNLALYQLAVKMAEKNGGR